MSNGIKPIEVSVTSFTCMSSFDSWRCLMQFTAHTHRGDKSTRSTCLCGRKLNAKRNTNSFVVSLWWILKKKDALARMTLYWSLPRPMWDSLSCFDVFCHWKSWSQVKMSILNKFKKSLVFLKDNTLIYQEILPLFSRVIFLLRSLFSGTKGQVVSPRLSRLLTEI